MRRLPRTPVLSYRRAAPLPCPRPSFDDSVHVRRTQTAFRRSAHAGDPTVHPSMPVRTARGRRFAGCSRVFQRSPAHAAQRSRPCTSFDAHVHVRRAMHAFRRTPLCLRSPHPKWMLTSARNRWRQVRSSSFDRRLMVLLDSLRCLPALARTFRCSLPPTPGHRSPRRSFDQRFLRHSCPPHPC